MKIKFGNRWYNVLDTKESCGITWYAIADEPNHIDWINNPEDIMIVMNYEQKYKEALEKARQLCAYPTSKPFIGDLQDLFPELKESEDEQHRKWILEYLYDGLRKSDEQFKNQFKCAISWLEKQGKQKPVEWHREDEQNLNACLGYIPDEFLKRWLKDIIHAKYDKPIDKVEPKFKVGDWVIDKQGIVHQIDNVVENVSCRHYGYDIVGGGYFNDNTEGVRLWTIKDATDGDVLVWDDSKCITLFKSIYDEDSFRSHGLVGHHTRTFASGTYFHDIKGAHPATKEQRDLLFQKMKEASYEWDADKKELIKL